MSSCKKDGSAERSRLIRQVLRRRPAKESQSTAQHSKSAGQARKKSATLSPLLKPQNANVGPAVSCQAAASTTCEAQELGEHFCWLDDATYFLDGIKSTVSSVRLHSMLDLLNLCTKPAAATFLHQRGIIGNALDSVVLWDLEIDSSLRFLAALFWALYCKLEDKPSSTGTQLLVNIFLTCQEDQNSRDQPRVCDQPSFKALAESFRTQSTAQLPCRFLTRSRSTVLYSLSERLRNVLTGLHWKEAISEPAVIMALCQAVQQLGRALDESDPTEVTVHSLWDLHRSLEILEAVCFASPESTAFVFSLDDGNFSAWLVQGTLCLAGQQLVQGMKKECLATFVSLIVNLTHNSKERCIALVGQGVHRAAAQITKHLAMSFDRCQDASTLREQLQSNLDLVCNCLGALINIAEHGLSDKQGDGVATRKHSNDISQLFPEGLQETVLLLSVIRRSMTISHMTMTACDEEACNTSKDPFSLVDMYASMLIGFLVRECAPSVKWAEERLEDPGLQNLINAIRGALTFYASTGTLLQENEQNLNDLISNLSLLTCS